MYRESASDVVRPAETIPFVWENVSGEKMLNGFSEDGVGLFCVALDVLGETHEPFSLMVYATSV